MTVKPPNQLPSWPGQKWGWQSWADAARKDPAWSSPRAAEVSYMRQLKSVGGRIRQIVTGSGDAENKVSLLRRYAETIGPWAEAAAANMASHVDRSNLQVWQAASGKISDGLRRQLATAVNGETLSEIIKRNAQLIKDLPVGAADKIAGLAAQATTGGMRAETLEKRIQALGDIGEIKAKRIALTEVSKASTSLTQVRAGVVGSEGYIWRTARDGDVRDSHARMEGKFVRWDDPQMLDGFRCHAGEAPNCRCYPEPVIPKPGAGPAKAYSSPLPIAEETEAKPERNLLSTWEMHNREVVPHQPGAPLPGADLASFDMGKLVNYALSPDNPRGRDKARVFQAALGVGTEHAEMIHRQILDQLPSLAAERSDPASGKIRTDRDGERFRVAVPVTGPNGRTVDVMTAWIYDRPRDRRGVQSDRPRLVTLFVK